MKKISILFVIVSLVTLSITFAQVEFGVRGGLNFNSVKMDISKKTGTLVTDAANGGTSYMLGMYALVDLKLFSIQPEVHYSLQSAKYNLNTQEHSLEMTYIQIPILGRFDFLEVLNVHAGPQFGIPLSYNLALSGGAEIDIKDQIKGLDLGLIVGVGVDIPMLGAGITFRYIGGLTDVVETPIYDDDKPTSIKNSMFQLSATYAFGDK